MSSRKGGLDANEILIEDPLDFLSASEKAAYIRAHQNTLMRDGVDVYDLDDEDEEEDEDYDDAYEDDSYEDEEDDEDEEEYEEIVYERAKRERAAKQKAAKKKTDRRRESKPVKETKQVKTRKAKARQAEEEEETDSFVDRSIVAMMKIAFAMIVALTLAIVWLVVLRPMMRSAMGLNIWQEDEAGQVASASGAQEAPEASGEDVVTTTDLNLRTQPSTSAEVIVTAPRGTHLTRLSEENGWSKVVYEGQELFCASDYLE